MQAELADCIGANEQWCARELLSRAACRGSILPTFCHRLVAHLSKRTRWESDGVFDRPALLVSTSVRHSPNVDKEDDIETERFRLWIRADVDQDNSVVLHRIATKVLEGQEPRFVDEINEFPRQCSFARHSVPLQGQAVFQRTERMVCIPVFLNMLLGPAVTSRWFWRLTQRRRDLLNRAVQPNITRVGQLLPKVAHLIHL